MKLLGVAVLALVLFTFMAAPTARAKSLLGEMQVPDTCGATYADKLASCTPFRCTKPGLMAMTIPSEHELKKMSPKQQQQLKAQMVSAEKRLEKMSPEKRVKLKARTTSHFEIKGVDAQGRCQTITMATPKYRQDCTLDEAMLRRVSDYTRVASKATRIQIKSTSRMVNGKMVTEQIDVIDGKSMSNPWQEALRNGQCKVLEKTTGGGWRTVGDKMVKSHAAGSTQSAQAREAKAINPGTNRTKDNTPPVQPRAGESAGQSSNTLFILDASGSMWGQIKGKPKITIAKEVMAKLVPELPDNARIGLIAYGHRRKGDCNDVETLVKLAANDKQAVLKAVKGLNAKGKTPLTRSVNQAIDMLRSEENASTVVLISDGIESCGGDPCAAVKAAKASGVNFILHTVGFGLRKKEGAQLQCMAKAGGGEYFQANNAEELLKSARKAVQPMGILKLTVKVNGKVNDLMYRVEDISTGKIIRQPVLPTSSGSSIQLPGGEYNVFISPAGVSGASEQKLLLRMKAGEVIKKTLVFGKGILHLTVTVNGKPAHALIHIEDSNTHKGVYESSVFGYDTPLSINLAAGKVDVVVQAGGRDVPEKRVQGVEIIAGETIEQVIPIEVKIAVPAAADASGMEQDTDRPGGGDFRHVIPASDNPALCQKACQDDTQCKSWTYVKPNTVQGPRPNCWLKTGMPPATHNTCCVSGVKH
jgi:Ca-activated chloride channel family protein